MYYLMTAGETKAIKTFLQSVSDEWLKMQFLHTEKLGYLITIFLKCGMTEYIFNSVLQTPEERLQFINRDEFEAIIYNLILCRNQMEDVDRFLSSLFSNIKDLEAFKNKFAKTFGNEICCNFNSDRNSIA